MDDHTSDAPRAYRSARRPAHAARRWLVVARRLDRGRSRSEARANRNRALRSGFAQRQILRLAESLLLGAAGSGGAGSAGAGRLEGNDVERFSPRDPAAPCDLVG